MWMVFIIDGGIGQLSWLATYGKDEAQARAMFEAERTAFPALVLRLVFVPGTVVDRGLRG